MARCLTDLKEHVWYSIFFWYCLFIITKLVLQQNLHYRIFLFNGHFNIISKVGDIGLHCYSINLIIQNSPVFSLILNEEPKIEQSLIKYNVMWIQLITKHWLKEQFTHKCLICWFLCHKSWIFEESHFITCSFHNTILDNSSGYEY